MDDVLSLLLPSCTVDIVWSQSAHDGDRAAEPWIRIPAHLTPNRDEGSHLFEVYFELTEEDKDILALILGRSLVICLSYTVFEMDQSGISDINTDCFIIYLLNCT